MAAGKTCGRCEFFRKVNWNDRPGSICFGRNGLCEKNDYNICSDSTYAQKCKYYEHRKYNRLKHNQQAEIVRLERREG